METPKVSKEEVLDFFTENFKMMHKKDIIPAAWNKYITHLLDKGKITERQHINWTDHFKKGR